MAKKRGALGLAVNLCGFAVNYMYFISKSSIAVFRVQVVCSNFKFYVAIISEKLLSRGDLLPFFKARQLYKS